VDFLVVNAQPAPVRTYQVSTSTSHPDVVNTGKTTVGMLSGSPKSLTRVSTHDTVLTMLIPLRSASTERLAGHATSICN